MTGGETMALDLMIVGAQKSGTTSLLAYLGDHPELRAQIRPEMTWFVDPRLHARPFPDSFYFGDAGEDGRLRLGKLAGLMYHDVALARLRVHNPAVKAIAILRDPVTRAYSSFWFARQRGAESLRDFRDVIRADAALAGRDSQSPSSTYIEWGRYAPYIERLQRTFGSDGVWVLIFEEFVRDPRASVLPLLQRLGLDPDPLGGRVAKENIGGRARSQRLAQARRSGAVTRAAKRVVPMGLRDVLRREYRRVNEIGGFRPPPMEPAAERELRALFAEPNRRLEELLGRPIELWRRPGP